MGGVGVTGQENSLPALGSRNSRQGEGQQHRHRPQRFSLLCASVVTIVELMSFNPGHILQVRLTEHN